MISAYSLCSGSSGNCFLVEGGGTKILVDAGISAKRTEAALSLLGVSLCDISAVFITHEHADHTGGLCSLEKKRDIPVHMTEGTARSFVRDKNSPILPLLYAYRENFSISLGDMRITSFSVPHDAAQPVGYTFEAEGAKLGFATDTGCVTKEMIENLSGCGAVVIEANHDPERLMFGPYPYRLKLRIMSEEGHLSNADAAALAARLYACGTRSFMLAHLSETNNTPALALSEIRRAVGGDATIVAARPDVPTKLEFSPKTIDNAGVL